MTCQFHAMLHFILQMVQGRRSGELSGTETLLQ